MNLKELQAMIKEELDAYVNEADVDVDVDAGDVDAEGGDDSMEMLRKIYDMLKPKFEDMEDMDEEMMDEEMDEEKMDEEGWLILKLEPVIDEIEDRMHDKLVNFQQSFFGSVGAMTKKAKELDPMNNVRKAAKDGDWMSLMVEYAANKAGLGALIGQQAPNIAKKEGETSQKQPLKTDYLTDYLNK